MPEGCIWDSDGSSQPFSAAGQESVQLLSGTAEPGLFGCNVVILKGKASVGIVFFLKYEKKSAWFRFDRHSFPTKKQRWIGKVDFVFQGLAKWFSPGGGRNCYLQLF